jgi:hypothetical protein
VDVLIGDGWRKTRKELEEGGWLLMADMMAYSVVVEEVEVLESELLIDKLLSNAEPNDGQ